MPTHPDFSKATHKALAAKGVRVLGTTVIPNMAAALPFASGETGYTLDDNGTGRVVRFADVLAIARG